MEYMYIFSIDTMHSFSIKAKCAGRSANAIELKIEIHTSIHFESKEQLTVTYRKCLLYVFGFICIILIKKNTWMLCQVRNVLQLHPRAKESRPHVLFLAKCFIGQRSLSRNARIKWPVL